MEMKFLQPFDTTDPFNDEARLEGFLSSTRLIATSASRSTGPRNAHFIAYDIPLAVACFSECTRGCGGGRPLPDADR